MTLDGDITPAVFGPGIVDNYNPAGLSTASRIRQATDIGGVQLAGIVAQPAGRILALYNLGPGVILLRNNFSGTPANGFTLPNSEDAYLPVDCGCIFIYDGTTSRWQLWAQSTTRDVSRELDTLHVHDQQGGNATADVTMTNGDPNGIISAPAGSICMDDATPAIWMNTDGATAWEILTTASTATGFGWFGDGSDGAQVYDGAATILGMAPVANVYTLTRDVYLTNATINNGVTVDTAGWRFFANGTLTLSGTGSISRNGNNGGNAAGAVGGAAGATARGTNQFLANGGSAGTGTSSGTPGGAVSNCSRRLTAGTATGGAGGGLGVNGTPGTNGGVGQGGGGGGGGGGAASGVGFTGGNGGTVAIPNAAGLLLGADTAEIWTAYNGAQPRGTATQLFAGSGGGGGGSFSVAFVGCGGGGSAGAYCVVAARKIAGTGKITSNGGAGGNGSVLAGGGSGGGGGGAGGIVVVITASSTAEYPDSQIEANGGAGGTGGTGAPGAGSGANGGNGGPGLRHIFRVGF